MKAIEMFMHMGLKNMHGPNKPIDFNKLGTGTCCIFTLNK